MAESSSSSGGQDIFDVRKIRRLVELMKEHELTEMDLQQAETRIQLRRGGGAGPIVSTVAAGVAPPAPQPQAAAPVEAAPPAAASDAKAPSGDPPSVVVIKSPVVGTFYSSPDPDSPPYVKVGDHVGPETTVCIVEAMKVFNEIPSEVSGKVVAMLVQNGTPVEFGQPLFKVDTQA